MFLISAGGPVGAQHLSLPPRSADALTGSEFARSVETLAFSARDDRVVAEILNGNVPAWTRSLRAVSVRAVGAPGPVVIWVTPDYLAVGSDSDYLLMPMSPAAAQKLADRLRMSLPTPRLVDEIWRAADVRLAPLPIPPSDAMTTSPVFLEHARLIQTQTQTASALAGAFLAGHKKDVVISRGVASHPDRVAIYGWHEANGEPIQPLYLGHTADWVDYSHGIRLVNRTITVDGEPLDLWDALRDPAMAPLLSGEGILVRPWY